MIVRLTNLAFLAIMVISGQRVAAQDLYNPSPDSVAWRYAGTSSDGDSYYIPKDSVGDIRDGWIKYGFPPEQTIITLKRFNCASGAERLLQLVTYQGKQKINTSDYPESTWSYSRPNSMGEVWLEAACGRRAREWTYFATSKDESHHFFKKSTLTRNGNIIRVWSKTLKDEATAAVTFREIDCANARMRILQSTVYADGEGSTHRAAKNENWTYAVPDSIGESLLQTACKAKQKSPRRTNLKP